MRNCQSCGNCGSFKLAHFCGYDVWGCRAKLRKPSCADSYNPYQFGKKCKHWQFNFNMSLAEYEEILTKQTT